MKVLHLITGLGVGGAEKHLLKLLPLMKETELIVCSLRNQKETGAKLEAQGIRVYYLSKDKGIFKILQCISNFRRVVKEEKPDVLCTYLLHADLFGRVFGRLFGAKKIICNIRVVFNEEYIKEVGRLPLWLEKATSWMNTEYITNSNAAKQALIKKQRIKASKVKVIPNGIDITKIRRTKINKKTKRATLGLKTEDFVICCIGRLHNQKGQIYLIRSMDDIVNVKKDQSIKCLFVGEGENRKMYEQEIKKLKLEKNIFLLGNRDDPFEILKASDLFVLPTNYEGMSNALLEAMACKIPIITTNIPENKEIISDGVNGLLVEPRNAKVLSEKIRTLLNDKKKRKWLSKNAFNEVKRYDIRLCAKRFEDQYLAMEDK